MTTKVKFDFKWPDGTPLAEKDIEIRYPKAGFVETQDGIVIPETLTVTTDADGFILVDLEPSSYPYFVALKDPDSADDGCCGNLMKFKFYVPDVDVEVRLQDLILDPPPSTTAYDEAAILLIMQYKVEAQVSASQAAVSATRAEAAADGVEVYADAAEASAQHALASENNAKASELASSASEINAAASQSAAHLSEVSATDSATSALASKNAAGVSATNAANSEASALASKNAAGLSETNAATSAQTATTQATNANTARVAAEAARDTAITKAGEASGSAASALASKNAAALSETNSGTHETNASASAAAALASKNAAGVSETNAGNSATAASNSAAAALASKNAAATSETNAGNSATAASGSAASALASKNAAATSETNAHTSEVNAAASAAALTGAFSDAGGISLASGSYPAKPTFSSFWTVTTAGTVGGVVYNVGDRLIYSKIQDVFSRIASGQVIDALDSTDVTKPLSANQGRILNSLIQGSNATLTSYEYIATAGQTVFSGNDRNGLPMAVNPGISLVVVNGSMNLKTNDYTLTNTTLTLVGGNPLAAGDIVQIVGFGQFNIADVYTKPQADTLFAKKGVNTDITSLKTLEMAGAINEAAYGTRAAAFGLTDLSAIDANTVSLTGAATINSWGPGSAGSRIRRIIFGGINVLTHNAAVTNPLNNLSAGNIVTLPGDCATYMYLPQSGAWQLLDYFRATGAPVNIVGTVSYANGIPTGAIIETGTNANGTYARFADGTQICWKNFVGGPASFSAGPIFTSSALAVGSFPIAFLAGTTPRVVATGYAGTGGWPAVYAAATASSWGSWAMYKEVVQSTGSTVMDLIAIGRWY
jgi:hypothetical protein